MTDSTTTTGATVAPAQADVETPDWARDRYRARATVYDGPNPGRLLSVALLDARTGAWLRNAPNVHPHSIQRAVVDLITEQDAAEGDPSTPETTAAQLCLLARRLREQSLDFAEQYGRLFAYLAQAADRLASATGTAALACDHLAHYGGPAALYDAAPHGLAASNLFGQAVGRLNQASTATQHSQSATATTKERTAR